MNEKNFGLLAFILLTFVLFILLVFNTVTLFAATPPTIDNYPQNAILENIQGGTFTLHHTFTYKQAASGYYLISVYWEYVNPNTGLPDNNYNFTLDNYRAYDNSGNWVECTIIFDSDNGSLHSQVFGNTVGDTNNYTFNVDIRYSLKDPDGTLHIVTDNHPFHYTNIDLRETNIVDAYPDDVTVKVLARGADVSISPGSQSGLPGAVINYTVTVKNTGTFGRDNYNLTVGDNSGWGDNIWLDNYRLENTPQGENRTTTLRVHIPTNATANTDDNIWVKATSQGDNTKSDNDNCIAHVTIVRGVQVTISPPSQENDNGGTLAYTITVKNTGNVQENFQLTKGDNTGWTPTLDNTWLLVPNGENRTTKLTVNIPPNARGCTWDNLWVKATSKDDAAVFDNKSCLAHVRVIHGVDVSISPDYQENLPGGNLEYTVTVANTGNAEDTYDLEAGDDAIWSPSVSPTPLTVPSLENRTATLSVTIPSSEIGGTNDNIIVTATSQENSDVRDNASCTAHATIVRGVDVLISPSYRSGAPGSALSYTVNVINNGDVPDNYTLIVGDNENWSPTLDNNLFVNVAPGDNKPTTLRVTVPDNAVPFTGDNIFVTAISMENAEVRDNDSCVANVALPRGVEVSISPDNQSGAPGLMLNYTVTVKNTGASGDNYNLTVSDNSGWGPNVSPASLTAPAGENRTSTLGVTVPENALGGMSDNIVVTATSQTDNSVSASDTCVTYALGVLTETRTVIYPTADIYAFGEYGTGYSRTQLKFDISHIPTQAKILSAKLWLYRLAADGWDGNIRLNRVDNQLWGENITASEFDAQTLTNMENYAGKFTSRGWGYLDATGQLKTDYGAANTYASFRLRWANDNGSEPSIGIDDGRFLVINSDNDELTIIFSSSEYDGIDPYLEVIYVPPYAVSVSISPYAESGLPKENLRYTVIVRNTGNVDDNYILTASDNDNWTTAVSPTLLFVASGSVGEATLKVTVPENATPLTRDNVIVTATSTGNPAISASASCIAHRVKINLTLITLYKVSLELDAYLYQGSRLVAKFYTYGGGSYQDNTLVDNENIPGYVTLLENISRPGNGPIQRLKLVLVDDAGNELQTIKIFETTRPILVIRIGQINAYWPFSSDAQKTIYVAEFGSINAFWPFAPADFEDP